MGGDSVSAISLAPHATSVDPSNSNRVRRVLKYNMKFAGSWVCVSTANRSPDFLQWSPARRELRMNCRLPIPVKT